MYLSKTAINQITGLNNWLINLQKENVKKIKSSALRFICVKCMFYLSISEAQS